MVEKLERTINMARDKSIDIAKGIGIILVVIGHVTSPVMLDNDILQQIYRGLYTFHMPLFFLLAGVSYGLASHKVKIGGGYSALHKAKVFALNGAVFYVGSHLYSCKNDYERVREIQDECKSFNIIARK